MKASFLLAVAAAVILAGCGDKHSGGTAQGTNAATKNEINNLATAPVDYLNAAVKAQKSAVKTIDVSYLNRALQQFNVQEGRYPKDLQELVPNYVAKIPVPPYGYKIVYDATSGTVTVVKQ